MLDTTCRNIQTTINYKLYACQISMFLSCPCSQSICSYMAFLWVLFISTRAELYMEI